jgi:predicted metal-binding membrane protein
MGEPAVARAVPIAIGVVVLAAGALQFTAWKARHLACCREAPGAEVRRRPAPARPGGTASASASTAITPEPA